MVIYGVCKSRDWYYNIQADLLEKQGVDRIDPYVGSLMVFRL